MRLFARRHRYKRLTGFDYLGVFLLTAALYAAVNGSPSFLDPDSFYHVKMAELLAQNGIIRSFPWLPYTTLAHAYADHHFLYHALLTPFMALFGSFVGAKVATVVMASGAVTAFYAALKAYGSRWPFAFTLMLATSSAFLYRMNLTKTSAISVTILLLALIAIRKEKPWALFVLSWLYVWTYGGWPIIIVVIGAFLFARAVADRLLGKHPLHSWGDHWFWRRLFRLRRHAVADFCAVPETRHAFAVLGGITGGLLFSPYFPENLRFYWEQIVQIAVVNYQSTIGVGMEWYPYPLKSFFMESSSILLATAMLAVMALTTVLWPRFRRRQRHAYERRDASAMIATTALALLFCALTLRSRRHIEYFTPFGAFAVALIATALDKRTDWQAIARALRDATPRILRRLPLDKVLATYAVGVFLFICTRNVVTGISGYREGIPWTRYATVAAWMRDYIPANEIIVHSDWDQFPILFLRDDQHRYICGLDPTFLYRQDTARYWLWVNVSMGKMDGDVAHKVQEGLGARYFFVDSRYVDMRRMLEKDPDIVRLYHDAEADIYRIR